MLDANSRIAGLFLFVAAVPPVTAQTYTYSPKGIDVSVKGGHWSNQFGCYQNGRQMMLDGGFTKNAMTVKEIALRQDEQRWRPDTGRTFANVTVRMFECDYRRWNATFAKNPTNTPTRVFSGSVTWPTAKTSTVPHKFDQQFPFQTSWAKSANRDLGIDWVFAGGKLTSGSSWGQSPINTYFFDSPTLPVTLAIGVDVNLGHPSTTGKGCVDTWNQTGGGVRLLTSVFNAGFQDPRRRGNITAWFQGEKIGSFSPYFLALGFGGYDQTGGGLTFPGVSCNQLYINPALPVFLISGTSGSDGFIPSKMITSFTGIPYKTAWAGRSVWGQIGWNDTRNGRVQLSRAAKHGLPAMPPLTPWLRHSIIVGNLTSATGNYNDHVDTNPILRYRN